jgi:hypothetical protein
MTKTLPTLPLFHVDCPGPGEPGFNHSAINQRELQPETQSRGLGADRRYDDFALQSDAGGRTLATFEP